MRRAAVIAILVIFLPLGAEASTKEDVEKANLLYNGAKYAEAAKIYQSAVQDKSLGTIANFNLGDARYRQGAYSKAIDAFNSAIASGGEKIASSADYNIGNSNFRMGAAKATAGDIKKAQEAFETALKF